MTSRQEKEKYLKSCGWQPWYHSDNWVHPHSPVAPKGSDYTYYGVTLDYAYQLQKKMEQE